MKLLFNTAKWSQDSGGFWLSLHVKAPQKARQFVDSLKQMDYVADLKEYRAKRSLDANSYFWALAGKLSAKLTQSKAIISPVQIYRSYIREIGDNFQIVPIREDAKDQWIKNWESHGIGWLCEDLGPGKLEGYVNIVCYYGSSTYDTAQMSRLIDLIVQDCKDQGIETATPEQLDDLKAGWES